VSLSRLYRCSSREHTRPCQSTLSCLVSGKSGSHSESRLIRGSWSARAREKRLTSALSTRCANTWQDSKKKWVDDGRLGKPLEALSALLDSDAGLFRTGMGNVRSRI